MTQQPYPPQQPSPNQQWSPSPGQPYPGAPYGPPRPPKKGMGAGAIVAIVLGSLFGLFIIIGVIGAIVSDDTHASSDKSSPERSTAAAPAAKPSTKAPATAAPAQSQADEFKAFVAKSGTDAEKGAIKHVVKVTGADDQNNILDTADIYTDFKGGLMSDDAGKAKLIAAAFADWKHSKNGLVTVYGEDGQLITNGKF
ncbi:hypothetical protein [Streptomyces roseicoloratus]|uniref:hypothetical protein n=1 Tax=Streptomyces roseicoloratus TaxID=2508722 RepID=UPI001FE3F29A|nr:hypothetical protein [Streptomyces roseicoloratus]